MENECVVSPKGNIHVFKSTYAKYAYASWKIDVSPMGNTCTFKSTYEKYIENVWNHMDS